MKVLLATLCSVLLCACHSIDSGAPIYGEFRSEDIGYARFSNTAAGDRFLKDRFMVAAVDGRAVVLAEKAEVFDVSIRSGTHDLLLKFRGYRPQFPPNRVRAEVIVRFEVKAGKEYRIAGVIEEKIARLWIEDASSGSLLTDKLSAPVVDDPERFDPVRRY